jgi:hypothetical protein
MKYFRIVKVVKEGCVTTNYLLVERRLEPRVISMNQTGVTTTPLS